MGICGVPFDKTDEEIIDAFKKANGLVSHAVKILDCQPETIYRYLRPSHPKYKPHLKAALDAARENRVEKELDLAETVLHNAMSGAQKDMNAALRACMYFLNNQGKLRKYAHPEADKDSTKETLEELKGVMSKINNASTEHSKKESVKE